AASLLGRTVGDFAIEAVIGGGSFGTVYRGRQLGLDRPVAIKVPTYELAADPVQARRFARAARAAARLVPPGRVSIPAVSSPGNADATRPTTGGLIGKPHYMSPEQAQGEHVDGRADLYALGCILFELVTAATPFDGSGFEVLLAHLGRPPPRASERNPEVPEV